MNEEVQEIFEDLEQVGSAASEAIAKVAREAQGIRSAACVEIREEVAASLKAKAAIATQAIQTLDIASAAALEEIARQEANRSAALAIHIVRKPPVHLKGTKKCT